MGAANFEVDLAGLNLEDDLDISSFGVSNPEEYQDQLAPAPVREGNYELRVVDFVQAEDPSTHTKLFENDAAGNPKWPVFEVRKVQAVGPTEIAGKELFLFQRIKTKPFTRAGADGDHIASAFIDFLRSFDVNAKFRGLVGEGDGELPTGVQLLKQYIEEGKTFRARGTWKAYDKVFADQAIAAGGGRERLTKDEFGRIIQKASVRGMRKFPQGKNGSYLGELKSALSGEILKASLTLSKF